jgi:hypothetical protein
MERQAMCASSAFRKAATLLVVLICETRTTAISPVQAGIVWANADPPPAETAATLASIQKI